MIYVNFFQTLDIKDLQKLQVVFIEERLNLSKNSQGEGWLLLPLAL